MSTIKPEYSLDNYLDRQDYLQSMFIHQVTNNLDFNYWSNPTTQRIHRPYERRFQVSISADGMRQHLQETYATIHQEMKEYLRDKYGFFYDMADNHGGRQMAGIHVQFMVDFRLEHRFLGSVIGTGNACEAAWHIAFGRSEDGSGESIMESDMMCTAIAYLLQMVCQEVMLSMEKTRKLPWAQVVTPPSVTMDIHGLAVKRLPKKHQKMVRMFDKLVKTAYGNENYVVGDFVLDLLACEVELSDLDTPETNRVLSYLRKEKKTLLEDEKILSGLLMDPRINNHESNFLSKGQKAAAVKHLMNHQDNYEMLCEKINNQPLGKNNNSSDLPNGNHIVSVADRVNKMVIGERPQSQEERLLKKLRGLEFQAPLDKTSNVLDYWRTRSKEDPELGNLAAMAFAESAPWASLKYMGKLLEGQKVTDDELVKLTFVMLNSCEIKMG